MSEPNISAVNETENLDEAFDSLTPSECGSSVSGSSTSAPIKSKISKPSSLKLSNTASPSRISRPCTQAPKPALPSLPARSKKKIPRDDSLKLTASFLTNSNLTELIDPISDGDIEAAAIREIPLIFEKPPFSEKEKKVLFDVVQHYKNIVEDTKTDLRTLKYKCKAWERIRQEFSVLMRHDFRSAISLRVYWENVTKKSGSERMVSNVVNLEANSIQIHNDVAVATTSSRPERQVVENLKQPVGDEPATTPVENLINPVSKEMTLESWETKHQRELARIQREQEELKLELLKLEVARKSAELKRDFPELNL